MGYAGIKIPGHSGTDFKHKKVFKKSQKILNDQPIYSDVRIEHREPKPTYPWFLKIKILFTILFFFIIFIMLSGYASKISNLKIHKRKIESVPFLTTMEKHRAAVVMFSSAKNYYNTQQYQEAQDEMTRVLKLYPHDLESIEMMYKILNKQCEIKNKYCDNAKQYEQYLSRINNE